MDAEANGTNGANGLAKRTYTPIRLDRAREDTPAPEGIGAWAEQLRQAAFDAVKPDDVTDIVAAQVEKAKEGDSAAAKFVLGYLTGQAAPKVTRVVEKIKVVEKPAGQTLPPPVRVEAAEPAAPPPVAVDSPAARQVRRLVAFFLKSNGPSLLATIEAVLEVPGDQLRAVLNCDWFAKDGNGWSLTPAGRQAVG